MDLNSLEIERPIDDGSLMDDLYSSQGDGKSKTGRWTREEHELFVEGNILSNLKE